MLRNRLASLIGLAALSGLATAAEPPLRYTGTGSCGALACHGGRREPIGLKGSEYAFFATYDPHGKAYGVLLDDRSKLIERNYRRIEPNAESAPERDATCLSCHVHPRFEAAAVDREANFLADGVGCESCHGPAERWLVAHSQSWWKGLSDRDKSEQFGMTATKDLTTRVKVCAECHLGSPTAEVNHDLIAAGHPRLLFEFANQQAKQPKHWPVAADHARNLDYEVRAWALGQAVGTRASLELLEARARRADDAKEPGPWPEFAEYDCYSCHHSLKTPSGRQEAARSGGRGPGELAWGNWNLPAVRQIAGMRGLDGLTSADSAMSRLEAMMAKSEPDAARVANFARMAGAEVNPLVDRVVAEPFRRDDVEKLLTTFLAAGDTDWTDAARGYLAFVALARARGDLGGPPIDGPLIDRLGTLRASLTVPIVRPDDRLVDSPAAFDPNRVRVELRSIRESFNR